MKEHRKYFCSACNNPFYSSENLDGKNQFCSAKCFLSMREENLMVERPTDPICYCEGIMGFVTFCDDVMKINDVYHYRVKKCYGCRKCHKQIFIPCEIRNISRKQYLAFMSGDPTKIWSNGEYIQDFNDQKRIDYYIEQADNKKTPFGPQDFEQEPKKPLKIELPKNCDICDAELDGRGGSLPKFKDKKLCITCIFKHIEPPKYGDLFD
jgi:hypothetical protein|tara:strand:+ start:96 stop:722 length:627 start_codon:yes stop_codon:yes gene_type:complete